MLKVLNKVTSSFILSVCFGSLSLAETSASLGIDSSVVENTCYYDQAKMLAMSPFEFDQDYENGWPSVADQEGCLSVAADLVRLYYQTNSLSQNKLKEFVWHEGQLRAEVGQYNEAIDLMEQSRKTSSEDDTGWNIYVSASIAFLRSDLSSLKAMREKLAVIPKPDDLPTTDGNGTPFVVNWPPNLDIVDRFIKCFGQNYAEAYGNCRD